MREERLLEALSEISEEYVREADPNLADTAPRKHHPLRAVLIAAAVAGLMVTAALAAGLLGGWEAFFGEVPDSVTAPVGVSTTSGDYTITLEETIVDEDGAAFLLSMRRSDGGALEGKPVPYDRWLDVDEVNSMGFSNQKPIYSADGKTAYYCFQFMNTSEKVDTLVGHQMTLSYEGIINEEWSEEEYKAARLETVSLAPLVGVIGQAEVDFPIYPNMEDPDFVAAREQMDATIVPGAIPLSRGGSAEYALTGGLLSKSGKVLALASCWPDTNYREGTYLIHGVDITAVIDTRTGERLDIDHAVWGSNANGVDFFELDRSLSPEDLPYLEAEIEYDVDKVLSDEHFELTFPVTESGYAKEYALDQHAEVSEAYRLYRYSLHLTSLRASALGLRLYFDDVQSTEKEPGEYTISKLIYSDGREFELSGGPGWAGQVAEKDYITLRPKDRNVLFDPDNVAAVQLGDTRIDLQ